MAENTYGPFLAYNAAGQPAPGSGQVYASNPDAGAATLLEVVYGGAPVTTVTTLSTGWVGLITVTVVPGVVDDGQTLWWKSGTQPAIPLRANNETGGGGPVTAGEITDAGATGVDLVQADTPAAARTALGLGALLSNVVVIGDAAATRVHPDTGDALPAGTVVIWVCDTQPAHMRTDGAIPDLWVRPVQVGAVAWLEKDPTTSATTHTLTLPAGLLDGDTLILAAVVASATVTATPTGVTGLTEARHDTITGAGLYVWTVDALAATDSGATITVTLSTAGYASLVGVVLRPTAAADVLAASSATTAASGATATTPAVSAPTVVAELQIVASASPGAGTTTTTVSPTADAYTDSANTGTNYGTSSILNARLSGPNLEPHLKFDLPTAPGGTTLVGARLRVRTSTDSAAGSAATQTVYTTASAAWTETGLTYATKPATVTSLGSATLAAADTEYQIDLNTAAVEALLGTTVDLAIVSSGTADTAVIWSRDYAGSGSRPALLLDFASAATLTTPAPAGGSGLTVGASAAAPGGAGAAGTAIAIAHPSLVAVIAGTALGGDAWVVTSCPRVAATLAVRAAS